MTRKVIIEPLAKEDINAARDRYEAARVGMGQEFFDAAIAVIDRLSRTIDGSITLPGEPRGDAELEGPQAWRTRMK